MRRQDAIWPSSQRPVQPGVIRPSRVTAVASAIDAPRPPSAKRAWWAKCQSFGTPSKARYWHIGETTIRLRSVTPRIR